jgi:uncharacterized repeat protein (TIGR01451 family)
MKNLVAALITALACALLPAARGNAQTLYGATSAGGPGQLYVLDASTGGVVQNVGPLNDGAAVNHPITGMAFHPTTGVLYGSTGNSPPATASLLVTIDTATALVTVIGPFNPGNSGTRDATMGDLAFDAAGNLYGVGTIGGPQLYSIDIATGQATLVGDTGLASTTGGGLAVSAGGTFYGTPTASRYGTYDPVTGLYTNITNPIKPTGSGSYGALDFDPSGVLFGLNLGSGVPPPTHLATIDPASGTVTGVGASVTSLDAIAFGPAGPDVTATKIVTGDFSVGGSVTYTVMLSNSGGAASPDNPGFEFTDTLPAGLTLVSADDGASPGTFSNAGNTVNWDGSIPGGGSATITIEATIDDGTEGLTLDNQGTVSFDADLDGTNESTTVTDDPLLPGSADVTSFVVSRITGNTEIPTTGTLGLWLLGLVLAGLGASVIAARR